MDQALYDPWPSKSAPTGQLQGRSSAYSARAVATRLPDSSDDSEPRRRGGSPDDMVHDKVSGSSAVSCCARADLSLGQAYDGRRSSYSDDSLDSLPQHEKKRPLGTPAREGNARMATFYERVSLRRAEVLKPPRLTCAATGLSRSHRYRPLQAAFRPNPRPQRAPPRAPPQ